MNLQITNGRIITPSGELSGHSIYCVDGRILEISEGTAPREGFEQFDAGENIVGPGGVDMHIHGGGGHDFSEGTEEAFRAIVSTHLHHGTTSLFPTLPSASNEMIRRAAEVCRQLMDEPASPVVGMHLEGPYFNPKKCGGQWPEYIRDPEPQEYEQILADFPFIRRWDAAPELPGADRFARYCRERGVVVGIGHTEADCDCILQARKQGFSHATHLYNAMTGVHNKREFKRAGTIEACLLDDGITVEIIADGIHVPPAIICLVHKIKGAERTALVTDAMASTGVDSDFVFDPNTIIEDGVCKLADRSALAGSIATMERLVETIVVKCRLSWCEAFAMTATTPARIMGVGERKGALAPGKDADIVVYSPEAKLLHVVQNGTIVR